MAIRVMIIDDAPDIVELIGDILSEEGYDIVACSTGTPTLDEIERVAPDVLILDLLYQGEPVGWEVLHRLKHHPPTANIALVLCTAASHLVEERHLALHNLNVAVLEKPFDIDEVVSTVQQVARHSKRPGPSGNEPI